MMDEATRDELQKLVAEWRRLARLRFECSDRTEDPMGKRVMDNSAFCYFNCSQELLDVLERSVQKRHKVPVTYINPLTGAIQTVEYPSTIYGPDR